MASIKDLRGKWRKFVKAIKERPELEAAAGDGAGCSAGGEGFGRWTVSCCKARFSTEAYQLYVKYQAGVHDDTSTSPTGYTRFLVETPLNRSPSVSRFESGSAYAAVSPIETVGKMGEGGARALGPQTRLRRVRAAASVAATTRATQRWMWCPSTGHTILSTGSTASWSWCAWLIYCRARLSRATASTTRRSGTSRLV
ncbi:arginyl-tRNA-protein transferase [Thecamonas trahens ATCC 50062]|uniref:Arginyl-tRNA-protein transferase n=1 Tax=Thecamonas trahens ATCC 50062 TaxID=461836 RepID=A0A0L0DY34_THETB|nr:arginyl-tRNA-protein transferase [Thecamonas trahens ATCC 50062]KNC56468.1 arginyl-tRNA-protein transferase [Thecamonas trahens ATCC 50062]|eukprot:XP_013760977.1 arginyl-tRNA-protein transferase [Thecamonas trahens ATCC 50062]